MPLFISVTESKKVIFSICEIICLWDYVSIQTSISTGQYESSKLINIGTNRLLK